MSHPQPLPPPSCHLQALVMQADTQHTKAIQMSSFFIWQKRRGKKRTGRGHETCSQTLPPRRGVGGGFWPSTVLEKKCPASAAVLVAGPRTGHQDLCRGGREAVWVQAEGAAKVGAPRSSAALEPGLPQTGSPSWTLRPPPRSAIPPVPSARQGHISHARRSLAAASQSVTG